MTAEVLAIPVVASKDDSWSIEDLGKLCDIIGGPLEAIEVNALGWCQWCILDFALAKIRLSLTRAVNAACQKVE